jgi:hypothetical protein
MVNVGDKVKILSVDGSAHPASAVGQEGIVRVVLAGHGAKPWVSVECNGITSTLRDTQWELPAQNSKHWSTITSTVGTSPVNPSPATRSPLFSVGERVELVRDILVVGLHAGDTAVIRGVLPGFSSSIYDILMDSGATWTVAEADLTRATQQASVGIGITAIVKAAQQAVAAQAASRTVKFTGGHMINWDPWDSPTCECGSDKCGSPSHSHWCPKYA